MKNVIPCRRAGLTVESLSQRIETCLPEAGAENEVCIVSPEHPGKTPEEVKTWQPPRKARGRRKTKASEKRERGVPDGE